MELVSYWEMEVSGDLLASDGSAMQQYGLQKEGEVYLLFIEQVEYQELVPLLREGEYEVTFIDLDTGEHNSEIVELGNGKVLHSPVNAERMALMIKKTDL